MDCIGLERKIEAEFKSENVVKPEPVIKSEPVVSSIIIKEENEREDDIIFIPDSPVRNLASVWTRIEKRKSPDNDC